MKIPIGFLVVLFLVGCGKQKTEGSPELAVKTMIDALNNHDSAALDHACAISSRLGQPNGPAKPFFDSLNGIHFALKDLRTLADSTSSEKAVVYCTFVLSGKMNTIIDSLYYDAIVEDGLWKVTNSMPKRMYKPQPKSLLYSPPNY